MSRPLLLLSLAYPLLVLAQQSELPPAGYNGGTDNPQDPSDAGAEGTQKGAFSLSGGAIAAIIVVAVIVVIGGSTQPHPALYNSQLTTQQSAQQHSGGSQRNANGMSANPSNAPRAASPAALPSTPPSKTAKTGEQGSASTRPHPVKVV